MRARIIKTIPNNRKLARGSSMPDFQLYYRAIAIKQPGTRIKNIDQWDKIDERIQTHIHTVTSFFWQGGQQYALDKSKVVLVKLDSYM